MWKLWWQVKHWLSYRNWNKIDKIFCSKFQNIKYRCSNPLKNYKNKWYENITCEWKTVSEFKRDMYDSYIEHVNKYWLKNTTIDRIDSKWNYCKENCRWATIEEQNYNKWNTLTIEIDWITYNSKTFAEKFWISVELASWRISHFLKGNLSFEWLCRYGKITTEDQSKKATKVYKIIDWKAYTYNDIAKITWLWYAWIRYRCKLFDEGKISSEELFKVWMRENNKHTIVCIIDWVEYNKDSIAKIVWCNPVTAWWRLKKFNNWEITKEQLFEKTFIWKNQFTK